jgi:hypothetical protein
VTVDLKEVKAPYPRFSGKGRYDMTIDVSVTPPQDEAVWKIAALDAAGKEVGSEERQLLLLRERPQTIVVNDLYCTSMPISVKLSIAVDANGQPKVAAPAQGGTGAPGQGGGGAPPSGSANPPSGSANPPSGSANPPSDGRGAGGGGGGDGGAGGGDEGGE